MRVCLEPGCPEVQAKSRCLTHRSQQERRRGSRTERGYGWEDHVKPRQAAAPLVATGNVKCWRCGQFIGQDEPWDLGHDDTDRSKYRGPEHVACNRATASR